MRVVVTDDKVKLYREDREDIPGDSCRQVAQWLMAWAAKRLADEIAVSIDDPRKGTSALCD